MKVHALIFSSSLLAMSCGAAPTTDTDAEQLGHSEQAVLGTFCAAAGQHQCWTQSDSQQAASVDEYGATFRWFVGAGVGTSTARNYVWAWSKVFPAGYTDNNGQLASPVSSVAVHVAFGTGWVYALSEDSVVRLSTGKPAFAQVTSSPSLDGVSFAHWTTFIAPLDKQGNTLSLQKIVSVPLPTNFGQGSVLLALSSSGSAYVQDWLGSERRWMPAAQHPGFAGLPSLVWSDISRNMQGSGGAFLLSSASKDIYRAGTGGITSGDGRVTWTPVARLPQIFNGATRLIPVHVGGRSVVTNAGDTTCTARVGCTGDDFRFYRYNLSTSAWERHTGGVPFTPDVVDLPYSPFVRDIIGTFTGFAVRNSFTHTFTWTD